MLLDRYIRRGWDLIELLIQSFMVSLCQTRSSPKSTRWTLYVSTCVLQKTKELLKTKCISKAYCK